MFSFLSEDKVVQQKEVGLCGIQLGNLGPRIWRCLHAGEKTMESGRYLKNTGDTLWRLKSCVVTLGKIHEYPDLLPLSCQGSIEEHAQKTGAKRTITIIQLGIWPPSTSVGLWGIRRDQAEEAEAKEATNQSRVNYQVCLPYYQSQPSRSYHRGSAKGQYIRPSGSRGREQGHRRKAFALVPNTTYPRPWLFRATANLHEQKHPKRRNI